MFDDIDWPLNASRGLSAIAELLVTYNTCVRGLIWDDWAIERSISVQLFRPLSHFLSRMPVAIQCLLREPLLTGIGMSRAYNLLTPRSKWGESSERQRGYYWTHDTNTVRLFWYWSFDKFLLNKNVSYRKHIARSALILISPVGSRKSSWRPAI